MDITDLFLNKLFDHEKLYKTVADSLGCDRIDGAEALEEYLSETAAPLELRVFLSTEDIADTSAQEVFDIIVKAAEKNDNLQIHAFEDEFLNLVDENNRITSKSMPRYCVHRNGLLHPTVHIWFIRRRDMGISVLLQKRSHEKEICPDCYDVSAAGHVSQGDEFRHTALREIHEELGIDIPSNKLEFIGIRHNVHDEGEIHDNELTAVYIYRGDVHRNELTLQESEVSEVCWAEIDELISLMKHDRIKCCVNLDEFKMIKKAVY